MTISIKIDIVAQLVEESLVILHSFGIPLEGLTKRRKEKMAKVFLAVAGINTLNSWTNTKCNDTGYRLTSRQIIKFLNENLDERIADSSYDDIRRKDLVLPVTAGIILKSSINPDANTNDGQRANAINPEAAKCIRQFGTPEWTIALDNYMLNRQNLAEQFKRERNLARISVTINQNQFSFSPGQHNELQKKIITDFLPRFGNGSEVLYVGDTENKYLCLDEARLNQLNFFEIAHDQLPDVIAYSLTKNWLFLIEAVDSANPISELRLHTLEKMAEKCTADLVYVTAFLNRDGFRKHVKDIAWETEVWIADAPDHLIHFNGDKFLGPYKSEKQSI